MKAKTNLLITIAVWALSGAAGFGQDSASTNVPATASTGAVFSVRFAAACQAFDSTRGRLVTTRITERDIIAQAVGGSASDRTLTQNFALAYNAAEDSLQVVNVNQQPVVDVIHFGGGAAIADNRQLARFTFLFFPGQTNEVGAETNVFGSAVITERTNQVGRAGGSATPNITGRLQFILAGGNVLGTTNPFAASGATTGVGATNATTGTNGTGAGSMVKGPGGATMLLATGGFLLANSNIVFDASAKICVGVFTTARTVPSVTPPSPPLGTSTNAPTTTNTTTGATTGTTGTTGTNGATMGGTTNGTTGGTIGFNPSTGTVITVPGTANIGAGSVAGTPGISGISGTTGIGTIGVTTTPGVVGTTGVGTAVGATPTGSGAITTGTPTGTGAITTGTGAVGTGTTGAIGTTGTAGAPITTGF